MTYSEFKKAYPWTVKNYPETTNLFREDLNGLKMGTVTIKNYEKRGGKWHEVESTTEEVTPRYYFNTVDAVPFFRNLGGRERVTLNYTKLGYIPVEITSIRPDGLFKSVRRFSF